MTDRDRALAALCDAFVPGDGDLPSASHLGVHRMLRAEVVALARPALVAELDQLLDTIESPILNVALTGRAVRRESAVVEASSVPGDEAARDALHVRAGRLAVRGARRLCASTTRSSSRRGAAACAARRSRRNDRSGRLRHRVRRGWWRRRSGA